MLPVRMGGGGGVTALKVWMNKTNTRLIQRTEHLGKTKFISSYLC